jgi:phosphate transport system substrate-binding protein
VKNLNIKSLFIVVIAVIFAFFIYFIVKKITPEKLNGEVVISAEYESEALLKDLSAAFCAMHPGVNLKVDTVADSSLAYDRLEVRQADAAIVYQHPAGRFLDEDTAFIILGKDKLSVVVNPENPIETITREQLEDIYVGRLLDWSDISDWSGRIRPAALSENYIISSVFSKAFLLKDTMHYSDRVSLIDSFDEMKKNVEQEREAIGFTLASRVTDGSVKPVSVTADDSSKDAGDAVNDNIEWCFIFRTKSQTKQLKELIRFVKTEEAQEIIDGFLIYHKNK